MRKEQSINFIAEEVSNIVPDCCGVTLGGSRAYGVSDEKSDVEMYFYTLSGEPRRDIITKCLNQIGAVCKRHTTFLWNEEPWGPHTFFEYENQYFEIGYRNVSLIENKIERYMNGEVMPQRDFHDLGLGYLFGSLAASLCEEKILISNNDEIQRLKEFASQFPEKLYKALKIEYYDSAIEFLDGKLVAAIEREDHIFYEVISSRIIRGLLVMAFTKTKSHFPGDKWNKILIMRRDWERKEEFIKSIENHMFSRANTRANMIIRRQFLVEAAQCLEV